MELSPESTVLVNTIADNKSKFTNRDYSRAFLALRILRTIGRPSEQKYLNIVNNEEIQGCPVTTDNVRTAKNILGPEVGSLQGKEVRRRPQRVVTPTTNIPDQIMSRYRRLILCIDIIFVNAIPLFMSISTTIKFGTSELLSSCKDRPKLLAIRHILQVYNHWVRRLPLD